MTLSSIFLRAARDRWLGWAISAASLILLLLFGMAVYRDVDLTIYADLPEVFLSLIGIGEDVDVGGLAIGYIFGSIGALVVAVMALVMGSAAIAGEERNGTMKSCSQTPGAARTSCYPKPWPSSCSRPSPSPPSGPRSTRYPPFWALRSAG